MTPQHRQELVRVIEGQPHALPGMYGQGSCFPLAQAELEAGVGFCPPHPQGTRLDKAPEALLENLPCRAQLIL